MYKEEIKNVSYTIKYHIIIATNKCKYTVGLKKRFILIEIYCDTMYVKAAGLLADVLREEYNTLVGLYFFCPRY